MSSSARLWVSMKPGASTSPEPSTIRSSLRGFSVPMAAIRPPSMRTLAARPSAPVPSRTVALTMRVAEEVASGAMLGAGEQAAAASTGANVCSGFTLRLSRYVGPASINLPGVIQITSTPRVAAYAHRRPEECTDQRCQRRRLGVSESLRKGGER
jgi:hypothetical protein